jgi:periplasmic divalent cation tolerance protein
MKIIYTTLNKKGLDKITNILIKKKLAKCISFWKIESIYKWKGKTVKDNEYLMEIKGQKKNISMIYGVLNRYHPYEVPFIFETNGKINDKYKKWLENNND